MQQLEELTSAGLEFLWVMPTQQGLLTIAQGQHDCASVLQKTADILADMDSFSEDALKAMFRTFCKESGVKMKNYMKVLRRSLSEAQVGSCSYAVT